MNDLQLVGDEDERTYREYLESIHVGEMKYMVTFKIYRPVDLEHDLKSEHPVRLKVELFAECPITVIDQVFIQNCKEFFSNHYGEMVIEKGDTASAFSTIREMRLNLLNGKNYIFC